MSSKKVFSLKEVEQHVGEQKKDVWIVIHDRVYNVTGFLDEHPGGEEVLKDMAGKVATENFEDVGHSTDARELMRKYEIGELTEEDKLHTKEKKFTWAAPQETSSSGWSWMVPVLAALLFSLLYRYLAA
ncbi:cytochrome b5-like isoform X3 [Pollicipes pollicipes]|nr:cytochrome b5-like isoform X3 [Pollicipes pollicipes]XP_037077600.1 cytochrome b5-like isoform X3 [Pollicipes pollicipes]XP_037077601.1 cytochrome b5-like isoform X3 [Pollicipes pollicipes]XP_037077602.1 cytochrome b5-like isoform X3 [Pollicipes pollicipes]